MKTSNRVAKIKHKYGVGIFRKWGKKSGGSPILRAYRTGHPVKGYRVTKLSKS